MADTPGVSKDQDMPQDLYLGPYENWNFGAGRPYAFPMIRKEFRYISAVADFPGQDFVPFEALASKADGSGWPPTIWKEAKKVNFAPFVALNPFPEAPDLKLLGDVLKEAFRKAYPRASGIEKPRFRVAFPLADAAMNPNLPGGPGEPAWQPDGTLRDRIGSVPRITVLAIIDDGIPFVHRNFRDASGQRSRIEFCWLQSARSDETGGVLFGREYLRSDIETLIADYGDDEDTMYVKAGAISDIDELGAAISRHTTHGSHMMDLATGYSKQRGEEPQEAIRVIAVQLPNAIAWDTSGFGKDMYMLSAFHYIFHRAEMIAKGYGDANLRLVVNFSYGFSGGRHDGGSELEAAIEQLVAQRREQGKPTALVLPSGNSFLDRLHGVIRHGHLAATNAFDFHWRIQPNDRTPSYLELWFDRGFVADGYVIALHDPWGGLVAELQIQSNDTILNGDPGKISDISNAKKQTIGQISADHHRRERWRVLIILAPSEPDEDRLPAAVAGRWQVRVTRGESAAELKDGVIRCWVQRDDDPAAFGSGSRQSYLDDPLNVRFGDDGAPVECDNEAAFVRRFGTINGLATARSSMVVAGFRQHAEAGWVVEEPVASRYSAAGAIEEPPQTDGHSVNMTGNVACSAMSDRSLLLPGTIASGSRSSALSLVQGTSTAAPVVARNLAESFVTASEEKVQHDETKRKNYAPLLTNTIPVPNSEDCRIGRSRQGKQWVPPQPKPGDL